MKQAHNKVEKVQRSSAKRTTSDRVSSAPAKYQEAVSLRIGARSPAFRTKDSSGK